jgi:anionic cell wall polymer biosynthesis LytR-Cps2A-Psr (LCP) family protein
VGTPVVPGGRRRRRAQQARSSRRWWLVAVLAVVVLAAVAAVATASLTAGRRRTAPAVTAGGRTQRTVLVGFGPSGQPAVDSAVLAVDPATRTGSVLLIPGVTIANAPGYGSVTVGAAFPLGPAEAAATVSDLLGVTLDTTWALDDTGLARLVDGLGRIVVTVDTEVPGVGGAPALGPGQQQLDGTQAVQYASYLGPSEPEASRAVRLQRVLDAILARLPAPASLSRLIAGLGSGSRLTSSPTVLASDLEALAASSFQLHQQLVPLTQIDTGGARVSLEVDQTRLRQVVASTLAESVPRNLATPVGRVLVEDNTDHPAAVLRVREQLDAAGLDYLGSQLYPPLRTVRQTLVLIFSDAPSAVAVGRRVVAALGLPASALERSGQTTSDADVVVLLGANYRG